METGNKLLRSIARAVIFIATLTRCQLPRMHALYDREPYTATTECRVCHLVNEDTWGMQRRKTLWPAQVAQQAKGRVRSDSANTEDA